ncbi:Uncharacterised protein [Salmonella enterica subsp. enterica]|nr:Uncharacterised protein [Salmonella enterica subsp. enterica]
MISRKQLSYLFKKQYEIFDRFFLGHAIGEMSVN